MGDAPFLARQKAGAPPAAESRFQDRVADLGRRHGLDRPGGGFEGSHRQGGVQGGGVDAAAVFEDHLALALEKRRILEKGNLGEGPVGVVPAPQEETVLQVAFDVELLEQFVDIFRCDVTVRQARSRSAQKVDKDLPLTVPHATDLDDGGGDAGGLEKQPDLAHDPGGAVGQAAGAGADEQKVALSAPAGRGEPVGSQRPALVVFVAKGTFRDAGNKLPAGIGRRVPALAAAWCDQLIRLHASPPTFPVCPIWSSSASSFCVVRWP